MKQSYCIILLAFILSTGLFAAGGKNVSKGGLGFLFPDHNSFVNSGQFALERGLGFEVNYQRTTAATAVQTAMPSIVYGNGNIGFGVYGARMSTNLTATTGNTDTVGAGFGLAMLKNRLTLGLSYVGNLASSYTTGIGQVSLNFNGMNREGISLGVSYSQDFSGNVANRYANVGLGWGFKNRMAVEINFEDSDLRSISDNSVTSFYVNYNGMKVYLGAGYLYRYTVSAHGAAARLGFNLGNAVDLSIIGSQYFRTGEVATLGGSLRFIF